MSDKYKDDKNLVLPAIKKNICIFRYISERLKKDKQIVKIVLEQDGLYLYYMNANIRNDKNFALIAIKQNLNAIEFINKDLLADKQFILLILNINGLALRYMSSLLQNDETVVLTAVPTSDGLGVRLLYSCLSTFV